MNAFEEIVAQYLEALGYWVRRSVKVNISKDDKKAIGLPTMPRPEIDLVALNMKGNELLLVEVKSFFDSQGVYFWDVAGKGGKESWGAKRFRLFANRKFRKIVTERLKEEFLSDGLINKRTEINYALAVGKFHLPEDEDETRVYFSRKGWKLFSPQQIKEEVKERAKRGWEDSLVTITAKLILRD